MSTRRNAAYNVAYRVFSILLPLVTEPYMTRTAGTDGIGLYSYAWTISYIFCLVAMLGLNDYGVRAIARVRDDRAQLDRTFSGIYTMQLGTAGTVLAVWMVYALFIAGRERSIAFPLTLMSVSCLVNVDWALMGLDEFRSIALRNTAVKLIAAASVFLCVKGPQDLWIYGLAWSLATLAGCLLCWPKLRGRVRFIRVPVREALAHLRPCAVLSVSVLAVSIYRQMDKVLLGAISGMDENGLYEDAEKIIYCLSGFISAIGTVMMPKAARMVKGNEIPRLKKHMTATMELILCMTAAMAFGIAATGERFAPLFFGEAFARSGLLMIPLGFTLLMIGFANVVRTQWVLPNGLDHIFVRSVLSGACVNLVLDLALIPRFGAYGAVAGTLAAELAVPLVQFVFLRRALPYRAFLRLLAEYAAIGAVMTAAVRLLGTRLAENTWPNLCLMIAAGTAVYGGLCRILWHREEHRHMLRVLRFSRRRKHADTERTEE